MQIICRSSGWRYDPASPSPGGEFPMNDDDRDYYLNRIAQEERAAEQATSDVAAHTHKRLAEEYQHLLAASHPSFAEVR